MPKEAMLYKKGKNNTVHCHLCAQHCTIEEDAYGFCGVRHNIGGQLFSEVYGRSAASHVDPIEKKPLYHFLPGSQSYSIGTPGCNFHCGFCQNWQISQIDRRMGPAGEDLFIPPEKVVSAALTQRCASISYTYTEPTIFFEYAFDTAQLARRKALANVFVTNGFMTARALDTIAPFLDAANVDLKAWSDRYYRDHCQGRVKPVLNTIRHMKSLGIWLEITTLVIPGENDSDDELDAIAAFIASVDQNIPWHLSRFHPQYHFSDHRMTPEATLQRAADIAERHGLRFIYQGNIPGSDRDTRCPQCGRKVILRSGLDVEIIGMTDGRCSGCGAAVAGRWR